MNGWYIASDEKGALKTVVDSHVGEGRLLNSADILLASIKQDLLTVSEADTLKNAFGKEYSFSSFAAFL